MKKNTSPRTPGLSLQPNDFLEKQQKHLKIEIKKYKQALENVQTNLKAINTELLKRAAYAKERFSIRWKEYVKVMDQSEGTVVSEYIDDILSSAPNTSFFRKAQKYWAKFSATINVDSHEWETWADKIEELIRNNT